MPEWLDDGGFETFLDLDSWEGVTLSESERAEADVVIALFDGVSLMEAAA